MRKFLEKSLSGQLFDIAAQLKKYMTEIDKSEKNSKIDTTERMHYLHSYINRVKGQNKVFNSLLHDGRVVTVNFLDETVSIVLNREVLQNSIKALTEKAQELKLQEQKNADNRWYKRAWRYVRGQKK